MTRWQRMTFTLDKSQRAILIFTAAAPEAVAEVIRLREELDELRAETQRGVEAYRGNTASLYLKQQHRHITRILNGDTMDKVDSILHRRSEQIARLQDFAAELIDTATNHPAVVAAIRENLRPGDMGEYESDWEPDDE